MRGQIEYLSIATRFCPTEFTLGDLRAVYEAVWDVELDPANFRRKILASGIVTPVAGARATPSASGGRPAQRYRATSADLAPIEPPFRRPAA